MPKTVRVLNTSPGAIGINSLPAKDKDGKPNLATVQHFHVPAQELGPGGKPVPGSCEIPEDIWKDLLAKDDFTRGHVESRRLVVDEPLPEAKTDGGEDQKSADPKGKPAK